MTTDRPVPSRLAAFLVSLLVVAHGVAWRSDVMTVAAQSKSVVRLATTTSTVDSGLFDAILPGFEKACGCRVDVIAVGTGQALELGRRGDVDVVLVHNREEENRFVAEKHARRRLDVMYNDFVIAGPASDPARIRGLKSARDAFAAIAKAGARFASRGDRSGTHLVERGLWAALGLEPRVSDQWYLSLGQGMGETLLFANERQAYVLTDRATMLAMKARLASLDLLVGGRTLAENPDRDLLNRYGVMAIDSDRHPGVNFPLATRFVDWLVSPETQRRIGSYGTDRFGQALYYPDSDEYKATREVTVTIGGKTRRFTVSDLQQVSRVSLADYEAVGVKMGPLGRNTWGGASLRDVLLAVDPAIGDARRASTRFEVVSSDGWTATLKWPEVFGALTGGEALYNVKGCNECHGVDGEGTSPSGKRPAPRLSGRQWPAERTMAVLRAGGDRHAGLRPYTAAQLSGDELGQILGWLARSTPGRSAGTYEPPPERRLVLLAYERNGRPMTGVDGLIQLIVGTDEFAGRYSHWVSSISAK